MFSINYDQAPPMKRPIRGFDIKLSNSMRFKAKSAGVGSFITEGCDYYLFSKPETLRELATALNEVANKIEANR